MRGCHEGPHDNQMILASAFSRLKYDPLPEWGNLRGPGSVKDKRAAGAEKVLRVVRNKLLGVVHNQVVSAKEQVQTLIDAATDATNLSLYQVGWRPFQ